ncbi:MAG TPA: histidine phosphatase family protein [Glaciihabitans sp.]|jgi:broad specificity phosphatase PhoE|nr:histidine phosphatase family protein [Glaciihabitans sp.]
MVVNELWLIRHGESIGNVAATAAETEGREVIQLDYRDADVPLTALGEQQADALGQWFTSQIPPTWIWSSPYRRAEQTITSAAHRANIDVPTRVDERLRDRELGVLDLLTSHGVDARFPEEAARRRWQGKYYYRPPGGESWADVSLRVRSFLSEISHQPADVSDAAEVAVIAAHDAVIMVALSLCLGMNEQQLLAFARRNVVANASVTRLTRDADSHQWVLAEFSGSAHLDGVGVPVTKHPGQSHE